MKKYIEHIKELGKDTLSNLLWKDNPYLKPLLNGFCEEITYIKYRYYKDTAFNVSAEIDKLKSLYIFNNIIRHAYNVSNTGMGISAIIDKYKAGQKVSLNDIHFFNTQEMQDYAFYDGTPVKDVLEDLKKLN